MAEYKLAKTGEQIDALLDKAIVEIAGVFASTAALAAAYPSGNTNLYRVGTKWYFWNGSAWTEGGTFRKDDSSKYSNSFITVVGDISDVSDLADYPLDHIFYSIAQDAYYKKSSSSPGYALIGKVGMLGENNMMLVVYANSSMTMNDLYTLMEKKVFVCTSVSNVQYVVQLSSNSSITALRLSDLQVFKAASPAISSNTTLANILGNSTYAQTIASKNDISKNQTTTILVRGPLENINGRTFQHYTSTEVTVGGFDCYKILKDGNKCTEQNASEYMEYMTGSYYLPKYNYDKPRSVYFIQVDGQLLKPQYDDTNGLLLYKLNKIVLGSQTIAGLALNDNITKQQLLNSLFTITDGEWDEE